MHSIYLLRILFGGKNRGSRKVAGIELVACSEVHYRRKTAEIQHLA